jgi:hypothetical protein
VKPGAYSNDRIMKFKKKSKGCRQGKKSFCNNFKTVKNEHPEKNKILNLKY